MVKKIVLSTLVTVSVMAGKVDIKPQDINSTVKNYFTEVQNYGVKNGGWLILNRKIEPTGETFITKLTKEKSSSTSENTYDDLIGLSFQNDINYTTTTYKGVSTLIDIPRDNLDKNDTLVIDDILKRKLIVINSDYSITNHIYNLSFKDINETINNTIVKIDGVKVRGFYDKTKPLEEVVDLSIKNIDIKFLAKSLLGEYFKLNDLSIKTKTDKKDKSIDLEYEVSLGLLNSNMGGKHSLIDKAHFNIKVGNLDAKVYEELEYIGSKNPELIDDKKIEELTNKLLLSKGLFIEIKDFSFNNIVDNKNIMGSMKITAKVSLDNVKSSAKQISLNPMLALSFLNIDARIELSKDMLNTIMKDPRAMMLAMLPPKKEKDKTVYVIHYSKGKLSINGQQL
jgi:transcriptional regulator CtsR